MLGAVAIGRRTGPNDAYRLIIGQEVPGNLVMGIVKGKSKRERRIELEYRE